MKKIIHIPHSSVNIPKVFLSDYLLSESELLEECKLMADTYTDKLVNESKDNVIVKFPYSKVFCDVERFPDEKEIMNKVGMGILYTHSHNLKLIRKIKNKNKIFKYYYKHHEELNNVADELLKTENEILFIDLHSYSNKPLKYELNKNKNRPDICIGLDEYHFDKNIVNEILYIIKNNNFTYSINEPFSGCLIPNNYYLKDDRIKGVMIEINKKILFDNFEKIKQTIKCITEM